MESNIVVKARGVCYDDIFLFSTESRAKINLEQAYNIFNEWSQSRMLTLDHNKTEIILFSRAHKIPDDLELHISDQLVLEPWAMRDHR